MPIYNPPATILLDTNILVRAVVSTDPLRQVAINAVTALELAGTEIYVCPQNMQEFRQVATRSKEANGLGWSSEDTAIAITGFEKRYAVTQETPAIYPTWRRIVEGCAATGRANFDGRLMAVASAAGIAAVLSFEAGSFDKFAPFAHGVVILEPKSL
jgi:predicted nucleic acid-binding protein